jgi:DNA processing protein
VDEERIAYLTLTQVPGIGPVRLRTLLKATENAIGALSAPFAFLRSLPGFTLAAATAIKAASRSAGQKIQEDAEQLGARVITPVDDEYPALLRPIPDPPPVLFALGDTSLLARSAAAVVGSRDHTSYGAAVCRMLAEALARANIVVVSGMARGLDAVAQTAALDCAGGTLGVLGNGLGVIYPAANRELYDRVARHGLLLSEFPPGERPHTGSFPRRNRLISGLSRVTVIVEAAIGSGALITADAALEQGREVMAVPGNITTAVSAGTNRLIRDGATPVLEAEDILQHFPESLPNRTRAAPAESPIRGLPETLSTGERKLAELMKDSPTHPDQLARVSGYPVAEVLCLLSGLEIAGLVTQGPGRMFRRV